MISQSILQRKQQLLMLTDQKEIRCQIKNKFKEIDETVKQFFENANVLKESN